MVWGCERKSGKERCLSHFLCIEGLDGCGKSTQIEMLAQALELKGFSVLMVRDPGGTSVSETIRAIILNPANQMLANRTELLLYSAARAQLVNEKIAPALEQGRVVLCDRFHWSTYAYQGYGRGQDIRILESLVQAACDDILPRMTFVLDLPVENMRERLSLSGKQADRLESLEDSFFLKVRQGYLDLAGQHSEVMKVLDARKSMEEIHGEILERCLAVLEQEKSLKLRAEAAKNGKIT